MSTPQHGLVPGGIGLDALNRAVLFVSRILGGKKSVHELTASHQASFREYVDQIKTVGRSSDTEIIERASRFLSPLGAAVAHPPPSAAVVRTSLHAAAVAHPPTSASVVRTSLPAAAVAHPPPPPPASVARTPLPAETSKPTHPPPSSSSSPSSHVSIIPELDLVGPLIVPFYTDADLELLTGFSKAHADGPFRIPDSSLQSALRKFRVDLLPYSKDIKVNSKTALDAYDNLVNHASKTVATSAELDLQLRARLAVVQVLSKLRVYDDKNSANIGNAIHTLVGVSA
jgi:hypothetical protein